jgi:MSHA biogenesis protein MshL
MKISRSVIWPALLTAVLAACGVAPIAPSPTHIQSPASPAPRSGTIPAPVNQVMLPPPPRPTPKAEKYTVVVNNVNVQELLIALARDAKVNVDISPDISGRVTLNAIDQSLPQILSRIAKQIDMRYELEGRTMLVMRDSPFLRNYKIDYVNMSRDMTSRVAISTQIATTGSATEGAEGGNNSTTNVTNASKNRFWETLIQNVKDILKETDKVLPEGSADVVTERRLQQSATGNGTTANAKKSTKGSEPFGGIYETKVGEIDGTETTSTRRVTYREAASVIANAETGIISVRATSRQHEKIQEFVDAVVGSARRQVLIEATVVEVLLNENYQAGVDWSRIANGGNGVSFNQNLSGGRLGQAPNFIIGYANAAARFGGNIAASIRLLDSFGTTRVLSSPKLMVLNNQTAMLKVVDNVVYFSVTASVTATTQGVSEKTFSTTAHSVPVGFVMSVQPQISDTDSVLMNVRPTISRISSFVNDPNPDLASAGVISRIPQIQTREMESVLKISNGQIAVLGGLMQDSVQKKRDGLPMVSRIPIAGDAFSFRDDATAKTELVIFLRPIVVHEASLDGDLRGYRASLPNNDFLRNTPTRPMRP